MAVDLGSSNGTGWLEATGLRHIVRVLGFAVDPAKLGIAFAAIVLTVILGGALDMIWKGTWGVDDTAIAQFTIASRSGRHYEEPKGESGIFQTWRRHQQSCVLGLLGTSVPGSSLAAGTNVGTIMQSHARTGPLQNLIGLGYGMGWLVSQHFVYFVMFGIGALFIWSWGGGALCRIAALQFACDEKPTMAQARDFAWRHLGRGFAPAPCIPLIGAAVIVALMALGGMLLRVPVVGDLLAATAFPLALLGGFVLAILIIGTVVSGSLFWPAIAVEAQDAYDAFSRGMSYAFSKPWKTVIYGVIALIYTSICWMCVRLFVALALSITRAVVSFGTSPFGWWSRGEEGAAVSKMDLLWGLPGSNAMHSWPDWSRLTWYEHYSAFLIGLFVLAVIAFMWAFLASFYFSASTVVYFLLRRDVDGTDLEEIHIDEEEVESTAATEPASGSDPQGLVSLPIVEAQAAPTPAVSPPQPEIEEETEPKKKKPPVAGPKRKTRPKKAPKPDDASEDSGPSDSDL